MDKAYENFAKSRNFLMQISFIRWFFLDAGICSLWRHRCYAQFNGNAVVRVEDRKQKRKKCPSNY